MTLADSLLADAALVRALSADALEAPSPEAARIAASLALSFGPSCVAIIHYGSHAQHSGAEAQSAYDYFVIVGEYLAAYRSLSAAGQIRRSARVVASLNRILPPNVFAIRPSGATPAPLAKCAVLSLADLERETSARARDHFVQGRLFQHVQLAFSRDAESRTAVLRAIASCRARTIDWGRPYLPEHFDSGRYVLALLTRSYAGEVRPEAEQRLDALTGAQRGSLAPVYDQLLQQLEARKVIEKVADVHRLAEPVPRPDLERWERYFRRSKRRATARWAKYVLLYDDWLGYLLAKVERRSGTPIVLNARERKWPLIFLWPKAIRYIRSRPQRRR